MWSKDGCRLVRTIPDVRGKESEDQEDDDKSDLFRTGVSMLEWGVESQRLIVLTKTRKLATVPLFRQVPCSCLGDQHVIAPIGTFYCISHISLTRKHTKQSTQTPTLKHRYVSDSSHILLVTHEGKRRKMIRPDEKYLRDNYPLRIASVSQSGERVAVAGTRSHSVVSSFE